MSNTKQVEDRLTEDEPINGQNFVCISFLSPEGIKNCSLRGLKIRGVYATKEEATKRCEELRLKDPKFHVFVGDVGKWLPWDPAPDTCKEQAYQEKELNDLMKGYTDNFDMAKKMHEQRRNDKQKEAAFDDLDRTSKKRLELQKKLQKANLDKKLEHIVSNNSNKDENTKLDIAMRSNSNTNTSSSSSSNTSKSNLDEQLAKIKDMQNKLKQKSDAKVNTATC